MVTPAVTGGGPAVKVLKMSVAPAATLTTTALGKAEGLPWEVLIPWVILLAFVIIVAQAWLDGTIIHRREYRRLETELEKWQLIVAQLNPALGLAVGVIQRKVASETQQPDVNIHINPPSNTGS